MSASAALAAPRPRRSGAAVAGPADRHGAPVRDARFDLFAIIFAIGTVHHELQFLLEQQLTGPLLEYMERVARLRATIGWPSGLGVAIHLADLAVAIAVMLLPNRRPLTALLAVLYLLSQLVSPERIPSHNSMMAAALAIILVFWVAEQVERRGRPARPPATDWLGWTITGLVVVCALTYFFASFHKWNPVFFSPRSSPAMEFVLPYTELVGLRRTTATALLAWPAILGTVLVELLVPTLLLIRRTRLAGCLLGLLLHLPMIGMGVMDFPITILAFYPLFFSRAECVALLDRCARRPSPLRLVLLALFGAAGAYALSRSEYAAQFAAGVGTDCLLATAHVAAMQVTLFLTIYATLAIAAALLSPAPRPRPIAAPA